ncbi:hypothetical protein ACA910_002737 [Epithemia clementina (nom. ined.)]
MMASNNYSQPDPYSGMTGTMDGIPDSTPLSHNSSGLQQQHNQQQQQPSMAHDPTQWSGAMDHRAAPVENYGAPAADANSGMAHSSKFGWRACLLCFNLDSYTQYFDIETADIVERLKASLFKFWMPDQFRTSVLGDCKTDELKGPDLYGPVWISLTLVFLIAVTSNIHGYWSQKRKDNVEEFEVDIHRLLNASGVVLVFVFCTSTAFWLGTNCIGMPAISWAMWVCVYGYSQVAYMPATILIGVLPFELISWCSLLAASAASVLLILRNLSTPLMAQDSADNSKAAPVILAILGFHTIYFIALKFWFFP